MNGEEVTVENTFTTLAINVGSHYALGLASKGLKRLVGSKASQASGAGDVEDVIKVADKINVYKGERSSITPDKVFKDGLTPKGLSNDLLAHVKSNSTAGNFVSTSKSKNIGQGFAGKNGYIYEIKTNRGIDVNSELGIKSPFPEQMEYAVPNGVNRYEIKGAWRLENGKIIEYIKNPNFRGD